MHHITFPSFFFVVFDTKQTFIYASNQLSSVWYHCYVGQQTFVYTLRQSQVFHVLATWGVLHVATWGVETESRAEKSQAVSPVTAMTGGG